jgi:hypothetical protein
MFSDAIDFSADVVEERCSKWLAITVRQIWIYDRVIVELLEMPCTKFIKISDILNCPNMCKKYLNADA